MNKYFTIFSACFILLAFFACKKTGVNQNLDPNAQKPYDFMSNKSGSYWIYGTRATGIYTRYSRNLDTIKNSLKYSYFERLDTSNNVIPEYFGKNGSLFITLIDLNGGQTDYLEYVFWIDSSKKGVSWNNTGSINYPGIGTVNILIESTEIEDSLTLVYNGTTYKNVVHVHSDGKATLLNTKVGTLDSWFIKGIGIIREEANIDILGVYTFKHTDSLLSYHIEQ